MRARLDTACRLAEDLIRFAERVPGEKRDILLSGACMAHGLTLTQMGRFTLSTSRFEEAIRHDEAVRVHGPSLFPLHPGAASRAQMGLNLWYLGFPDRAVSVASEGIALAGTLTDSYSLAFAIMYCAGVHQMRGEPEKVLELSSRAMAIADKPEHRYAEMFRWSATRHGWAIAKMGRPEEGIAEMRESLAANKSSGSEAARAHFLSLMAAVLLQFDRCSEALDAVEETLATIASNGSRFYLSEALRLKGEILLHRGASNRESAREFFHQGLAVAREQDCRGFELRILTSLSRLGDPAARADLRVALNHFKEGLETYDLVAARSVLGLQPA
jgi:tetratricopeptide (TPR) repeat protein